MAGEILATYYVLGIKRSFLGKDFVRIRKVGAKGYSSWDRTFHDGDVIDKWHALGSGLSTFIASAIDGTSFEVICTGAFAPQFNSRMRKADVWHVLTKDDELKQEASTVVDAAAFIVEQEFSRAH